MLQWRADLGSLARAMGEEEPIRRSNLVAGDIAGDFVLVSPDCAISPQMKLSVRLGRFDLEANGNQAVDIYYDPLLSGARLPMPETESRYHIKSDAEPEVPRMIPFFSERQEWLYSFGFLPRSEGNRCIFTAPQYEREDADQCAQYFSSKLGNGIQIAPFELLQRVVGAIGMLTGWPADVFPTSTRDRIEVRMAYDFLRRVTEKTGHSFDNEFTSENLISIVEL
jgi:hypothetical protein